MLSAVISTGDSESSSNCAEAGTIVVKNNKAPLVSVDQLDILTATNPLDPNKAASVGTSGEMQDIACREYIEIHPHPVVPTGP